MKVFLYGSLMLGLSLSAFGQNNQRTYTDADCKKGVGMMRQGADKCLGMKNFDQRAKCFDDISEPVSREFGNEFFENSKCRVGMDELKAEVLDKKRKTILTKHQLLRFVEETTAEEITVVQEIIQVETTHQLNVKKV